MTALLPSRATGLLHDFAAAGVLSVADVQVAARLGALTGTTDEQVLLAAALVVRSTRHGSVVLDLAAAASTVTADEEPESPVELSWPEAESWVSACAASRLVTPSGDNAAPVRMAGSRLWLDRYWRQEAQVVDDLLARSATRPADLDPAQLRVDLDELFVAADADQRLAVAVAALSRVSVIGGGPGTGKTTTIARLLAVLLRQRPELRVALAAPTGKAAARLEEAVHAAAGPLASTDRERLAGLSAATLHRLLGRRPGAASRFRYDRDNRLPFDVVVVDECSMVSLTLMARLLEAVPPAARLVLVGDPDQLASVEAGAVLGDLVDTADVGPVTAPFAALLASVTDGVGGERRTPSRGAALRESVALLRTVHRFDAGGAIAELAEHVRAGRADEALQLLHSGAAGLVFHVSADDTPLTGPALDAVREQAGAERLVIESARAGDVEAALRAVESHRLLCAHRDGPRGVRHWSDAVERWLISSGDISIARADGLYPGQPLLVTANDYENGLFNGDTGVVIASGETLLAAFRRGGEPVLLPPARLSEVRPLHAMTVHRAQGSQFDQVTVLLPAATSPLATRQTLYTAITRAVSSVRIIGSDDAVRACVQRRAARATGLRDRIDGTLA
jgi:exodeoxyribonuclease V alpha subunit